LARAAGADDCTGMLNCRACRPARDRSGLCWLRARVRARLPSRLRRYRPFIGLALVLAVIMPEKPLSEEMIEVAAGKAEVPEY